jgi:hypothetical protein
MLHSTHHFIFAFLGWILCCHGLELGRDCCIGKIKVACNCVTNEGQQKPELCKCALSKQEQQLVNISSRTLWTVVSIDT